MTRPPDHRQRTPDGFGCLVCYFMVVGFLSLPVLLVGGPGLVRDRLRHTPPAVDADQVEAELAAFGRAVVPELQAEIETLTQRQAVDRQRCDALRDLLARLGRNPADDPDYTAWVRELGVTETRLTTARREREDNFLRSRKAALSGR